MRAPLRVVPWVVLWAVLPWAVPAAADQTFEPRGVAVLGGMDKVTGRITELRLPIGTTGVFGTLGVTVRACHGTPPYEAPESVSFLQITDNRSGDEATVFSGWMFASTPGVSALEHPVYDIWVVGCTDASPEQGGG